VKDVKKLSAKDYNFLVLGPPTRFGTMSFAIRGFLGKVKSEEWMNKPFAALGKILIHLAAYHDIGLGEA